MRIDDNGFYWFRQSWLNDFMLCPERARIAAFHPHLLPQDKDGTDATTFGTAVHMAIELFLQGATVKQAYETAWTWLEQQWLDETFRIVSIKRSDTHKRYLANCLEAWINDLYPQLMNAHPTQGMEHTFNHIVEPGRWGLSGTWDYLDEYDTLWDWKTAGSNFRLQYGPKALLKKVQPTVYSLALRAWQRGDMSVEDVLFVYGIMVKGSVPEAVTRHVTRNVSHFEWLCRQVDAVIHLYEQVGPDEAWPLHDNEWHCSEEWCENWQNCKGSVVTVNKKQT